jgi:hypothetical protein
MGPTMKQLQTREWRWIGIIFILFACLFIAAGIGFAATQAGKLRSYLPIPATVTGVEVQTRSGSDTMTYAPLVHFTYRVDGAAHAAHTPFPLDTSSSGSWAYDVVGRYHAGQLVTAWYNPADPDQAFLEREVDVLPYLFILFPMLFACIGLAGWPSAGRAALDAAGMATRVGGIAALWWLVGLLAASHFASIGGALRGLTLVAFGAYAVFGIGLLLGWSALARKARVAGGVINPYAPPPG